jgi:exodeoxyribonuclease VII small subunit
MGRAAAPGAKSEPSFENALERLEAVVVRLESGALSLEEALAAFEEGVTLSRRCSSELEAAERRIEVLMGDGSDGPVTVPFEADEGGDSGD